MNSADRTRTLTSVKAIGPGSLHVEWSNGMKVDLDLSTVLDDRAFADGRTASLRRKGGSRRKIALGLRAKGVDAETAAAALAATDIDEAEAALRLARRRRLGPWRVEPRSDDRAGRDRDSGVLVRQGFAYSLARQVIGMGLEEAEERLAGG